MTLTPIPRETYFNQEAADWAYETVMKMADDEAQMFAYFVACEMLDEDIQKNLDILQPAVDKTIAKRVEMIRKSAARVISKGADVDDEYLNAVGRVIEFAKNDWDPRLHVRGGNPKNRGQFSRKVTHVSDFKPIKTHQAQAMGIPDKPVGNGQRRADFQQEYLQIAQFLEDYKDTGNDPVGDQIFLTVQNRQNPDKVYRVPMARGDKVDDGAWDPRTERVMAVTARPSSVTVGGSAFMLGQALGQGEGNARTTSQVVRGVDQNLESFSNTWTQVNDGDVLSDNARTYRRIEGTAKFVGAVAPDEKVKAAAKLAELVGQHGPEAEKVVGPQMRKTAYRYRGTEKNPDPRLVRNYAAVTANAKSASRGERSISQMATDRAADIKRQPTWEERTAGREEVVRYLNTKLPNRRLYGLNLAAGNTPPSQGVIVDKNGKIVTEAVGYGDDHYLPFNLKNLKGLQGGEYIRTRSVGGPTSEDIYTGLMTGARQVTVTSRSGTFTIQFDETFKGGRRYNDKAKRMVDRYEHLLDAVESEQVDNQPVRPQVREMIEREVKEKYGTWPKTEQRKVYNQMIEEYKSYDGLDEHDMAVIDFQMNRTDTDGMTSGEIRDLRRQLVADAMAEKEFKFRLNGEGYHASLMALQEQFPYYISVAYKRKIDEERPNEPEKDSGYVMPRHNRPAGALHGYFNPRIQGEGTEEYKDAGRRGKKTGKIQASEANFQNVGGQRGKTRELASRAEASRTGQARPANEPLPSEAGGAAGGTGEAGEAGRATAGAGRPNSPVAPNAFRIPRGPGNPTLSPQDETVAQMVNARHEREFTPKAWAVLANLNLRDSDQYENEAINLAKNGGDTPSSEFVELARSQEGRMRIREGVDKVRTQARNNMGLGSEIDAFEKAAAMIDRPTWSRNGIETWHGRPYEGFEGKAYSKAATYDMISEELNYAQQGVKPLTGGPYAGMDKHQMKAEFDMLIALKGARIGHGAEAEQELRDGLGVPADKVAAAMELKQTNKIDEQLERLHRVRLLKANLDGGVGPAQPPAGGGGTTGTPGGSAAPGTPPGPATERLDRIRRAVADLEGNPRGEVMRDAGKRIIRELEGGAAIDPAVLQGWLDLYDADYGASNP